MSEPRVMAPQTKIGARPSAAPQPAAPEPEPSGGGRKRMLSVLIGAAILAAVAGAYWFLMGPGAASGDESGEAAAEEQVEAGAVQVVDSISVNLEGGHYLRLGLGLQLTADGHGDVDTAQALDAAIALFSGRTTSELADPEVRDELKATLAETLGDLYHGDVMGVYYTDFVTQ
ncbi:MULTISPECIES: flagellar basal body-associated FliL family protein [Demequina]|uniref:Flagellar protein FliL n=1 Tax=Demequina litorisediminis TaxID=1849022 RepID=A0ABQ6IFY8_9MICO|nr:flagellar basal body-associated FliL family protein [Demequina litorisediminis]GMA35647.1 hypothetical protein GCM10025876_18510 [Demequina litorisediminis]